jgi:hypothetical protein
LLTTALKNEIENIREMKSSAREDLELFQSRKRTYSQQKPFMGDEHFY